MAKNKIRQYKKIVGAVQFHLQEAIEDAKEYEGFLKIDDDNKVNTRCTVKYFCIDIDIDVGMFGGEKVVASIYSKKLGRQHLGNEDWLVIDAFGDVKRMNDEDFKKYFELVE